MILALITMVNGDTFVTSFPESMFWRDNPARSIEAFTEDVKTFRVVRSYKEEGNLEEFEDIVVNFVNISHIKPLGYLKSDSVVRKSSKFEERLELLKKQKGL
mgnify:CR=1 FL=1